MSSECESQVSFAVAESGPVKYPCESLREQGSLQGKSPKTVISRHQNADADPRDDAILNAALAQLKASEFLVHEFCDTTANAVFTMDANGNIESFNEAAAMLFGYSAADVVGKNADRLIPLLNKSHGECLREYLAAHAARIGDAYEDVIAEKANGTKIPIELAISEVRCGDRHVFTAIVRDFSALKLALRQLKECNDELASHALAIAKVNRRLQRSSDDLNQLAYAASHDLQEPLRKVVGFCQALQDDYSEPLDETARSYINYAVEGARRMKTLITDLLSYSRVQTQGKPMEPTDAGSACDEAIHSLSVTIDNVCADVTRKVLPIISADPTQLVCLFQNLISNAIKYRREEVPRVQVDAEELQDEWLFRVRDNGLGIDPQYHLRIFIIFQRLHARDEYSGTGIGLAICKRIVERMNGRIWVESSLGDGSTFCFTVPKSLSKY